MNKLLCEICGSVLGSRYPQTKTCSLACHKQRQHRRYIKNRPARLAYQKANYAANRAKRRAYRKAYYAANKEKCYAATQKHKAAHRARYNAYQRLLMNGCKGDL